MISAAAEGQTQRLQHLLDCGADVNYFDESGLSALHWAALSGFKDVVEVLVNDGADMNALSDYFGTPLCLAAFKSRIDVVHVLLASRASPTASGQALCSPIHCAAWTGDLAVLKLLLARAPAEVNLLRWGGWPTDFRNAETLATADASVRIFEGDQGGEEDNNNSNKEKDKKSTQWSPQNAGAIATPLSTAVMNGKLEAARWLIDQGANVFQSLSRRGEENELYTDFTLLHEAPIGGNLEIARLLLGLGADVNAASSNNMTPLHYAAVTGTNEVLGELINAGASVHAVDGEGLTPLMHATSCDLFATEHLASQECIDFATCVRWLIANGADVNARSNDGNTALLLLASGAWEADVDVEIALDLLHAGAEVDVKNDKDDVALVEASRNLPRVASLLIDRGARIEIAGSGGMLPLHRAAENGHEDLVRILISRGTSISRSDDDGNTPLLFAAINSHFETVSIILDAEPDAAINATTGEGVSALSAACCNANENMADLLLRRGANPNGGKVNRTVDTVPLCKVSQFENYAIATLLLDHGADVSVMLDDGRTPVHLAAEYNSTDVIQLLISRGGSVHTLDSFGRTPMSWAAEFGHVDAVATLLAAGGNAWEVQHTQEIHLLPTTDAAHPQISGSVSAMDAAVSCGWLDVLKLFDRSGVDICGWDGESTALHTAASTDQLGIAKYLIDRDAPVHLKDWQGRTPLVCALQSGFEKSDEIVAVLREAMKYQSADVTTPLSPQRSQSAPTVPAYTDPPPAGSPPTEVPPETQVRAPDTSPSSDSEGWFAKAVVIHAYTATELNEIDLERNDIILIHESWPDNSWLRGTSLVSSKSGFLPQDFVQIFAVNDAKIPFEAIALGVWDCTEHGCLIMGVNDRIMVTDVIDAEWWRGTSTYGVEGNFPARIVEVIPDPAPYKIGFTDEVVREDVRVDSAASESVAYASYGDERSTPKKRWWKRNR